MRAYRHAHTREGTNRRLSQGGLLDLMGQVDPEYLSRHDHSTVARWESGARHPTMERLVVFGRALDLAPTEIDGLLLLAGLDTDSARDPIADEQAGGGEGQCWKMCLNSQRQRRTQRHPTPFLFATRCATPGPGSYCPVRASPLPDTSWRHWAWNSSVILAMYVGVTLCALLAQDCGDCEGRTT